MVLGPAAGDGAGGPATGRADPCAEHPGPSSAAVRDTGGRALALAPGALRGPRAVKLCRGDPACVVEVYYTSYVARVPSQPSQPEYAAHHPPICLRLLASMMDCTAAALYDLDTRPSKLATSMRCNGWVKRAWCHKSTWCRNQKLPAQSALTTSLNLTPDRARTSRPVIVAMHSSTVQPAWSKRMVRKNNTKTHVLCKTCYCSHLPGLELSAPVSSWRESSRASPVRAARTPLQCHRRLRM